MLRWVFRVNGCFEEYFTILNCNVHMRLPEIAHYILWDCRFRDVFALNMTPLNRSVVVVTCETTPDSADIWHSKSFWLLFFVFALSSAPFPELSPPKVLLVCCCKHTLLVPPKRVWTLKPQNVSCIILKGLRKVLASFICRSHFVWYIHM